MNKIVEFIRSMCFLFLSIKDAISSSRIQFPFTRILSLNFIRCGEVYKPTFLPDAFKTEASMEDVDPLPFVPAI